MQERILIFFKEHATPLWDTVAETVTMLGEQYFFIALITFAYWLISRREGFKLAAIFVFSSVVNVALKIAFRAPRPFETLPDITGKRIETATGYSFPSGHTQGSASFFTAAALILKRWWITLLAAVLIVAVAVTRVYLGVHWPVDVAAGLLFGILIAVFLNRVIDRHAENPKKMKSFFITLEALVFVFTLVLFILDTVEWRGSLKISDFFKISGISLGLVAGYFLEERYVHFDPRAGSVIVKILRYLLGLGFTLVLLLGLKVVLPEHMIADYLRYAVVGLWVAFLWPLAGSAVHLFTCDKKV